MKRLGLSLLGATFMLVGCGADIDELTQWMEQQKRAAKPNVEPIVAPKKFAPQPYSAITGVETFSSQKIATGTRVDSHAPEAFIRGSADAGMLRIEH